jgi:hypothetical protein
MHTLAAKALEKMFYLFKMALTGSRTPEINGANYNTKKFQKGLNRKRQKQQQKKVSLPPFRVTICCALDRDFYFLETRKKMFRCK